MLIKGIYALVSDAPTRHLSCFSVSHSASVPTANAAFVDGAFVAGRFRIVQSRRHAPS